MTEFHARRLLVATPLIGDGNFERTVVLLLEHNADGAIGLVLNRPSSLVVAELLTGWEDAPGVLFSGGPVSPETLIGLSGEWPGCTETGWQRILGNVGSVNLSLGAEDVAGRPGLRIFFGYAGWRPSNSRARSPPVRGSSSTRSRTTCSVTSRRVCGGRSSAVRGARCPGSRTTPTTRAPTELIPLAAPVPSRSGVAPGGDA